jgi:tetratricopeptide (TPR) repeat protein
LYNRFQDHIHRDDVGFDVANLLTSMTETTRIILACSEIGRMSIQMPAGDGDNGMDTDKKNDRNEEEVKKMKDEALRLIQRQRKAEAASMLIRYCEVVRGGGECPRAVESATYKQALGQVYYCQGDYERAIECFEFAQQLYENLNGNDPCGFMATSLLGLALVAAKVGRFDGDDGAVVLANRAVDALKATVGEKTPACADAYDVVGTVERLRGNFDVARKWHKRSLDIKHAVLSKKCGTVARSHRLLAGVLLDEEEYDVAIVEYNLALEIMCGAKDVGDEHPDTGACYLSLASICRRCGAGEDNEEGEERLKKCLEYYSKALYILQALKGAHHVDIQFIYEQIADVLQEQGSFEQASYYYDKVLTIAELHNPRPAALATIHYNQGCCFDGRDMIAEALSAFDKTLALYQEVLMDENAPAHRKTRCLEGGVAAAQRAREVSKRAKVQLVAVPYLTILLTLSVQALGSDHLEVASIHDDIGVTITSGVKDGGGGPKDIRMANEHFRKALDIYTQILPTMAMSMGMGDTRVQAIYERIKVIGGTLGRPPLPLEVLLGSTRTRPTSECKSNMSMLAPSPVAGFIRKRGHHFKTMRKRYLVVTKGALQYRTQEDGPVKGGIDSLAGYTITVNAKNQPCPTISFDATGKKDLFIEIDSVAELRQWEFALNKHLVFANALAAMGTEQRTLDCIC